VPDAGLGWDEGLGRRVRHGCQGAPRDPGADSTGAHVMTSAADDRRDDGPIEALARVWDREPWEPIKFEVGDRVSFRRSECDFGHEDIPDRQLGTVVRGYVSRRLSTFDERRRSPNWNGGHTYPVQFDDIDQDGDFRMIAAVELIPISDTDATAPDG